MNMCPQCHSVYGDDFIYCLNDGTLLTARSGEQETVVRPRSDTQNTRGPMVQCPTCGHENRSGSRFCKTCGESVPATPFVRPLVQSFGFTGGASAAAGAFEQSAYKDTVHIGQPGIFTPPKASFEGPVASSRRIMFFVGGGLVVGVALLIALAILINGPKEKVEGSNGSNGSKATPSSSPLPSSFDRSYKGYVLNPRRGTDITLTMSLQRSDEKLTGWVTTNRKTDEVRGNIKDNGEFELTAYENGEHHSGYWAGRITADGSIEDGQWMDKYKSESTTYTAHQQ